MSNVSLHDKIAYKHDNNNNNNNNQDNVYGAVIMAEPLREFTGLHPVHLMNVERRQAAADPRPNQTT